MRIVFVRCATASLGIESLSAALKERGHETALVYEPLLFRSFRLDIPFLESGRPAEVARRVVLKKPDLVAFGVESDYCGWSLAVAREVKRLLDVPTVFGGIHATLAPESLIHDPSVDYVCIAEGEEAICELAEHIQGLRPMETVTNVWAKRDGEILRNPVRLVRDLDALPFPDKTLFHGEFPGFVSDTYTLTAGRGCPNACSYCHNSAVKRVFSAMGVKGPFLRRRSVANVIEELRRARKTYAFKRVTFCDDIFITDRPWLFEFARRYPAEIGVPYFCQAYPAHLDEETVRLLEKSGCGGVNVGIQTVNEEYRRRYLGRRETNAEIARALALLGRTRIFTLTNFIIGLPGETDEDIKEMVRFAAVNPADFNDANWLRFYPGTRIIDIAVRAGLLDSGALAAIDAGRDCRPYAHGGHSFSADRASLRNLLFLANLLPTRLVEHLLKKDRYRVFPSTTNLRNFIGLLHILRGQLFRGKLNPYSNLSISGSVRYFLHYAFKSYILSR